MKSEKGMTIVEMTLIFPAVFFAVMVMLYFGLFKLQEAALLQMVQRVAMQGSNIAAYPGYITLGEYDGKDVDLASFESVDPAEFRKSDYQSFYSLYREIFGSTKGWDSQGNVQNLSDELISSALIFPVTSLLDNEVTVERGFFGDSVTVRVAISIPMPAVIRYFDLDTDIQVMEFSASSLAARPGAFIHDIDLAYDTVKYVAKKTGHEDILSKAGEWVNKGADFLFGER